MIHSMKFHAIFKKGLIGDVLALIAGALMTLSFAPFRIEPLAIIALALLGALWLPVSKNLAAKRGWLFGLGLFGTGVYWVYISIHDYGNVYPIPSLFLTLLFIAVLALFPAMVGYLLNRYFSKNDNIKLTLAFPALWVSFEWIRSWIFTGFPWLIVGYSQIHSPLKGFAPIFGVFSVSLAVLYSSVFLIKGIRSIHAKKYRVAYMQFMLLIALWTVGGLLTLKSWTKPFGPPIKVSLVQGNIPEQLKWTSDMIQPTLDTYRKLSAPYWKSDIVIWPESAIPITLEDASDFVNEMDAIAKKNHTTFITGIPVSEDSRYYNAVIALGDGHGFYLKHRLVPFGEYIPFRKVFHLAFDILHVPMTDFSADKNPAQPIEAGKLKLLTFICYEIAFPEQVNFYNKDINLLLTVNNDAWFNHSTALSQHLEMAAMRALEVGRPVLFVSNSGITAIIDAKGNIQSEAEPFVQTVLTDKIQPTEGRTPWQYLKMDPVLFIIVYLLAKAAWQQRTQKYN